MDEPGTPDQPRKYIWPRFALAAALLAILLGFVWMNAAVQKLRAGKSLFPGEVPGRAETNTTVPQTNAAASKASLIEGGNAEDGRKIFFEKPEANCAKCHKVAGVGGDLGPALDNIALRRSRQELLDALLSPNARVLEGFESVILLLKNNTAVSGLLKKETEAELHVLTPEDGLTIVRKDDLQLRQRGMSPMPEGLAQLLSEQELRDLIEFMSELR